MSEILGFSSHYFPKTKRLFVVNTRIFCFFKKYTTNGHLTDLIIGKTIQTTFTPQFDQWKNYYSQPLTQKLFNFLGPSDVRCTVLYTIGSPQILDLFLTLLSPERNTFEQDYEIARWRYTWRRVWWCFGWTHSTWVQLPVSLVEVLGIHLVPSQECGSQKQVPLE